MNRRVGWGVAIALMLAGSLAWIGWVVPTRRAVAVGAGMLAKQMCSCIHVAGRTPDACRSDQMAMLDPIQFELVSTPDSVRAFVPLLGERIALYREGFGCTLE